MPDYDDLHTAALELFGQAITAARRADAKETLQRLQAGRDRLAASLLTVVVCGEFSRGKSTLLNALLDQKEDRPLLPVGISYTTSVVTTIAYGDPELITVQLEDGDSIPITRAELSRYVTQDGNPGNSRQVASVSIQTPSDLLASGLAFIDTPGIGGVFTAHAAVTSAVIPLADAIVFVADVVQPMTASEIRFLRRAVEAAGVSGDKNSLICVLTKIDRVSDYDAVVAGTRAKLAEATGWPRVQVVPVSSQAKLDYNESRDTDDLTDSNFPELRRVLWDTLARRRATAVLAAALQDVDGAAAALLQPVEVELAMLRAAGPQAAAKLRKAIEERRLNLEGLGVGAATWRGDLLRDVEAMAADARKGVVKSADQAWRNVPGYLDDNALLDDPDRLFERLGEDLAAITSIADRQLYDRAARLQRELAGQLGLDLGPVEIRRLPPPPVPAPREAPPTGTPQDPQPDGQEQGQLRKRLAALRASSSTVSVGTTVGSVLGRLIGMFILPGAGPIIGGTVGATAGLLITGGTKLARWRNPDDTVRRQSRAQRRKQLRADLDDYYQQVLCPYLKDHVAQVASDWGTAITAETDSRIRQLLASTAKSAARIASQASASQEASQEAGQEAGEQEPDGSRHERTAAREAALVAERESLQAIRQRATELAVAAAELAAS